MYVLLSMTTISHGNGDTYAAYELMQLTVYFGPLAWMRLIRYNAVVQ